MIRLRSCAKINLGLEIVRKREDGFHDLKTIFQTVDLWDTIDITKVNEEDVYIEGSDPEIDWNSESNTIKKAFRAIMSEYPVKGGFRVKVGKNIPAGGGLGGGSGNAAVVMLWLNNEFNLNIPADKMIEMSKKIGADVPFFLFGGTALAEGTGEKIELISDGITRKIALINPGIVVNTGVVFSRFSLTKRQLESKISIFCESGNLSQLRNDLEKTTFGMFPEIASIKEKLEEHGCELVLMSGSGSSVFAVIDDSVEEILKKRFENIRIINTVSREEYIAKIGASPSGKASVFGADTAEVRILPPQRKK